MLKVVIVITTYNLEKYIAMALDSILCQKTNFEYKIIIADDCSNDGTIEVINKYKELYPDKIELRCSYKNLGSLKNSNRIFDGLQCEYFSFLDGDDYWVGENRLQKQVDFLDGHSEYILCGGNTQYLKNNELSDYVIDEKKLGKTYTFESLLKNDIPFVHTSSLLVRNVIFNKGLPSCFRLVEDTFENCALRGEDFRRLIHLEKGPMYIMNEVFSVYRIHEKGIWQGSSCAKRVIESAITYNYYYKYFGERYGKFFLEKAQKSYRNMMSTLLVDYNLCKSYKLSEKESLLLTSFLNDLNTGETLTVNSLSSVKKKMLCFLVHFFFAK